MADQTGRLNLQYANGGGNRSLQVTFKDAANVACEFVDYGNATTWVADADYILVGAEGDGSTAPATAKRGQFRINGSDRQKFLSYANLYDPKSSNERVLGAAMGSMIPRGTSVTITSR